MICYCAKNKINGKLYFGITDGSFSKRKIRHKNDSNRGVQFLFHKALRKYGFDNFEWNYIDYTYQVKDYDELKEIEIYYIKKYRAYVNFENSNGYNMTLGGDGGNSIKVYQYDKKTLKLLNIFGSMKEAATKTNIIHTNISKCCRGERKSAGGYIWCYESSIPTKYKRVDAKKVYQYNRSLKLLNIFDTIADAFRATGIDGGSISKCCSNILYSAGGYIWKDKELVKDIV